MPWWARSVRRGTEARGGRTTAPRSSRGSPGSPSAARRGASPRGGAVAGAGAAEPEWLAGLSLVGKDRWIPKGGRVRRPSAIGVGGRYEDFREGVLDAGTVVPNRRWYEERSEERRV